MNRLRLSLGYLLLYRMCLTVPWQKARLIVFKHDATQAPGDIGARIDGDAIGMHFGSFNGRAPMHDDLPEIRLGFEELFSDRQQIGDRLILEPDARTNSSVNKEVVAKFG